MSKKGAGTPAEKVAENSELLSKLLEDIQSKKEATRYKSFKVLSSLSEERPEVLYPQWNLFESMLSSDSSNPRYIALHIIANLTKVDKENKFDRIFEKYFALLDDENLPVAAHLAGNSGRIAEAKPELQSKITDKLLSIDKTHHSPEHKSLIKSYAVESLNEFFAQAKDKKDVMEFVMKQLDSKSPRTRKTAKEFVKKWEKSLDGWQQCYHFREP